MADIMEEFYERVMNIKTKRKHLSMKTIEDRMKT
jgi:hypothetical protein